VLFLSCDHPSVLFTDPHPQLLVCSAAKWEDLESLNHVGYITNHKKRFDFNKFLKEEWTTWKSLSPRNDTLHDLCWVKGNSTLTSHAKYVHVTASELGVALSDTCAFWEGAHWSWALYTQVHANVFGYDICNFLTHPPSTNHPFYPYDVKVPRPFLL